MTQYFFDLVTMKSVHRDCDGQPFASLDQARQQAVLIAMDLGCSEGEAASFQVQVRDVVGRPLFAVPMQSLAA